MQGRAAEDLHRLVTARLSAAGLGFTDARALSTPRRLALVVDGLGLRTMDQDEPFQDSASASSFAANDGL